MQMNKFHPDSQTSPTVLVKLLYFNPFLFLLRHASMTLDLQEAWAILKHLTAAFRYRGSAPGASSGLLFECAPQPPYSTHQDAIPVAAMAASQAPAPRSLSPAGLNHSFAWPRLISQSR